MLANSALTGGTVHAGEVVALLGPNGAGKSTTLLALPGELPPLAGRVTYLEPTRNDPLHCRVRVGLGFVPEERSVFHSLTVAANLRLGPDPSDVALSLFPELRPLLGRRAGLCSGGEQQILSLARARAAGELGGRVARGPRGARARHIRW